MAVASLLILLAIVLLANFGGFQQRTQSLSAQTTGICDRTVDIRSAILRQLDVANCAEVTSAHLTEIEFLYVNFRSGMLVEGDLDGLTGVVFLGLRNFGTMSFTKGIFNDLKSLEFLYLRDDTTVTVPADTFTDLPHLQRLIIYGDAIAIIDPGAFNGLNALVRLSIYPGALTEITLNTLSGLANATAIKRLLISGDELSDIAPNAFDDLENLENLRITAPEMTAIQTGTFNGLGNLKWLIFNGESVTTVEANAFRGVGESIEDDPDVDATEDDNYTVIHLTLDAVETLAADTFSGLPKFERLAIGGDMLATLEPGVFNGLTNLDVLYIDAGELTTVHSGVFDDLPEDFHTLRLNRGAKETLASGTLSELPGVVSIDIWDKTLDTITAGSFDGLTSLNRLLFDEAGNIVRVENRAFYGLTGLTTLDLSNNMITSLPDDVFDPLISIEQLILTNNPLTRFPSGFVASPPCTLKTFDIGGFNFSEVPFAIVDGVKINILATLPKPGVNGCSEDQGIRHLFLDGTRLTQHDLDLIEPYALLETLSLSNTGITIEQAVSTQRGRDNAPLKSLGLSGNDLSGLNQPVQRPAIAAILNRLSNLEQLHLANTKIDGDTALAIVQNVNPNIKELSLANNNLVDWNHPDLAIYLTHAFQRFSDRWDLIDLSNTAINSQAASAIVPHIERTHEGIPEEEVEEVGDARFHGGVTLDLSNNYLTNFSHGWLRNWEFLDTLDISCNEITSLRPETFLPVANHLETIIAYGNPFDPPIDPEEFETALPDAHLHLHSYRGCQRSNYSVPKSIATVLRIEPSIASLAIKPGRTVRLHVDAYGRQDILENQLADSVVISWDDQRGGGTFSNLGRVVEYTAPRNPGIYNIVARIRSDQCHGDFQQCTAHFQLTVTRGSTVDDATVEPVNPKGQIPTVLTDDEGAAYEVITPVVGGQFIGDGYTIEVPTGAVQNDQFIGIRVEKVEAASNVGQTHHRYTLAGDWYRIGAIDGNNQPVRNYRLNRPAQVCLPLPHQLRTNINDIAIVATLSDNDSFIVLSSRVHLQPDGAPRLCANLSNLPAKIAAAKKGSPSPLPQPSPGAVDQPSTPETGGRTLPIPALLILLLIGITALSNPIRAFNGPRRTLFRVPRIRP